MGVKESWDGVVGFIEDLMTDQEAKMMASLIEEAQREAMTRLYLAAGASLVVGFILGALIF
jgi:hypothetical protein